MSQVDMGGELVQRSSSTNTLEDEVFENSPWLATTSPSLLAGLSGAANGSPFDDDDHKVPGRDGQKELPLCVADMISQLHSEDGEMTGGGMNDDILSTHTEPSSGDIYHQHYQASNFLCILTPFNA